MARKIDVFCHILPQRYYDYMVRHVAGEAYMQKRVRGIPALYDLGARFRILDAYPDYFQVLSLAAPPLEAVAGSDRSPELARVANDAMAELVDRHPDRFVGFVASLPMNHPEAAVQEADRAITELGATGVQIYTNVNGKPLDGPEYLPLFERMSHHDLPLWVHPTRPPDQPDYPTESRSKYDIWWTFGWPYETSVFMARVVFGGLFDRFPNLKILTHHMGGMVPYFEGRVGWGLDQLGTRTDVEEDLRAKEALRKRPLDYFRAFYADTALFGALPATECGIAFFGAERVLFATDFPFDPEGGSLFIRETIRVIENVSFPPEVKQAIFEGNARRLLRLRL
ncbi:MAG: amidohydrolase family protein [Armatimonadota bacterium]|nr:amidohydrolase family protein [Armatimonadota bacterium]MDR7568557.1 amidohydrolase family protein [Armatimonadota bacterium]